MLHHIQTRRNPSAVVAALVLVAAAGLKLTAAAIDWWAFVAHSNPNMSPQIAAIVLASWVEITVAGALFLHSWDARLLRLATLLFASFAMVNFRDALHMRTTCRCFGSLAMNPWISGMLDVVLALALFGSASSKSTLDGRITWVSCRLAAVAGIAASATIFGVIVALYSTGLSDAVGAVPVATHSITSTQFDPAAPSFSGKLWIANLTRRPIRILGAISSCTTHADATFPLMLAPGEVQMIRWSIAADSDRDTVSSAICLWVHAGYLRPLCTAVGNRK